MAYREFQVSVTVADDSNKSSVSFDRTAYVYQTKDLESISPSIRVGPADSETQISMGTVTTGYAIAVYADYPIRLRLNSPTGTQFIMHGNNVPAVNTGAPLPPQCVFVANVEVTALYVQPIVNAAQTANVWVTVTGDPASAYQ